MHHELLQRRAAIFWDLSPQNEEIMNPQKRRQKKADQ